MRIDNINALRRRACQVVGCNRATFFYRSQWRDVTPLRMRLRELRPATTDAGAKETARARLRLVEEFHQDGFFQFSIPDDSVKIVPLPNGGREVNGMAQVVPHGGIRA